MAHNAIASMASLSADVPVGLLLLVKPKINGLGPNGGEGR